MESNNEEILEIGAFKFILDFLKSLILTNFAELRR